MRAAGAALVALCASIVLGAQAGAGERHGSLARSALEAHAFGVPRLAPPRDVVIVQPSRAVVRSTGSGSLAREPVNDGAGRSIEVIDQCVPLVCQATPQEVASFLGTVPHHDEMNLLTVVLTTPAGVASQCGSAAAQACYFPGLQRMVINGDKSPAPDGASWEFVVAHEYGHHLANNRNNSPFNNPALDWGPKRWGSYERVCEGVRAGIYFPGDEGVHYFENPGEAFAESFAFTRFPSAPVPWHWTAFPVPDAGAFAAITTDALQPWSGPAADERRGRFAKIKKKKKRKKQRPSRHQKRRKPVRTTKRFATPNDGILTVRLAGTHRADLALKLIGPGDRLIARSDGVGSDEQVSYMTCGERSVTAVVKRRGRSRVRFRVTALVP